ncbi:MAG: glycosyltransferase family 39 protein [Candidatus Aenigmatarchaeota archaeon]
MKPFHILLIILFIAFLVRATFIGTYFTGDAIDTVGPARNYVEIGRAAVYATNASEKATFGYIDDGLYFNFTHPPMRVVLYSLWAAMFGFSNAIMILLPIIFGLLSIVFIYFIGKKLYSERVGLIAAAIAAIIRYHFYGSVIGFGDNFLMFTVAASMYFFYMYAKTAKNKYIILFFIPTVLGFLTKLSVVTTIPIFFVFAIIYRDKIRLVRTIALIILATAVSFVAIYFSYPITESFTGVSNNDFNFFDSYIGTFFAATKGYQDIIYEKSFYLSSYVWQFTPFFAALIILSATRLKRDRSYYVLASWLAITFLVGFLSSGQDFQRFMVIGIAPAILLVAKYVSDLKFFKKDLKLIGLLGLLVFLLAFLTGLSDLSPTYELWLVGMVFLIAIIFIVLPKKRQILIGASIGLSIFFLVGTNFLVNINSSAVKQLTNEVKERNYPYYDLWTDRDISMYLAPEGKPPFLQRAELNQEFIKKNNIAYIAFYSIYKENDILNTSRLCEDKPFFAKVNGRNVGLTCKINKNKI